MTMALVHDPPYMVRKTLKQGLKIDFIGLGLLSVGLGFLQVMLDKGQTEDWFESRFIVTCAVIGVLGLAGVILWELRQSEPLVDLRLFAQRNYSMATFMMFAMGVDNVRHHGSASDSAADGNGLHRPVGWARAFAGRPDDAVRDASGGPSAGHFSAALAGGLRPDHPGRGNVPALGTEPRTGFWTFVTTWAVSRAGMPFLFVPINVMAFAYVPREKTNNATGLINLTRNLGGSVGISLVAAAQNRLAQVSQANLTSHLTPLNPIYTRRLAALQGALQAGGSNFSAGKQTGRTPLSTARCCGNPQCWRSWMFSGFWRGFA